MLVADGIIPLYINWGESPHPAHNAAKGATLVSLSAQHPDVRGVREMLRHLGLDLPVSPGQSPALIAIIEGPRVVWNFGSSVSVPQTVKSTTKP